MDNNYEWEDITQELFSIRKELKMMELIKDDPLTLEDCMQAQQINDDKMDPKFDISHIHTIQYKLDNKLLKLPADLTLQDTAQIFANITQLEAAILQGQPLASTIYTFAYLYDRKICQDSYLFTALIESIHSLGSYFFELIKQAGTIKEDDVTIPGFSFSRFLKTHDEVSELILQAEKKFEVQYKKNEDKTSFNFVLHTLRFRRSLHLLIKNLGNTFEAKNQKKIQSDLQGLKKKLVALEQVKYGGEKVLLDGVFLNDIHKTIKVHFGPRQLKLISLQCSLQEFRNALQQIQLFIPVPTKMSELKKRIEILSAKPYNGWSKSYIKSSIFLKEHYIFSSLKTEEALVADINDWVHLTENAKTHEKFANLIKTAAPVVSQTLYRFLGNSMRWFWECSKIYEDYNVLIHMANEVDSYVGPTKQLYISSWFYYYGLELMIKQILVGFEHNLYELSQLKYVFYVVESVLGIIQRNGQIYLHKLDKTILQSFSEGTFNKKIKKKMNDNEKCMFANVIFKKGLHLYFRALFKVICILHARNWIPNKFESTQQVRIKHRFRIFKHVLFTRTIDYKQYKKTVEEVCKKETQFLDEALAELKEVKNVYKLFVGSLEEGQTYFRQRQDAELLEKFSVKASVAVMTLKMNMKNKKIGIDLSGRYPQFTIE